VPARLRRLAEITNLDLLYEIKYDGSLRSPAAAEHCTGNAVVPDGS
jgi:hypothetical protein